MMKLERRRFGRRFPIRVTWQAMLFGRVEVLKTGDQLRTSTYPSGVPFARLDALPNASFHPFVEPAPTSHATAAAEFARQIFPRCPGLEHKQNPG
jgi:hypothetical protein